MEPEFGHMPVPGSPHSGEFPVFSLLIRELAEETSSPQTSSSAISSAAVETSGAQRGFGRERPAISRALAVLLWRIRTGDDWFRAQGGLQPVVFSVVELGGSDSLLIRLPLIRIPGRRN